jgi:hypothetical protein
MICPHLHLIYTRHWTVDTFCPDKVYILHDQIKAKHLANYCYAANFQESLVSQVSIVICLSSQKLLTICTRSKLGHVVPGPL